MDIILMHRVILNLTDPKDLGDHDNRNGLDNQRHNLRKATRSQNGANRKLIINTTSKYIGVYLYKRVNKWKAQIQVNNKKIGLGTFKIEKDAALAYNKAAIKYHKEFANLNKI